jgi:uncharacterized protein (TIGR03067 family)
MRLGKVMILLLGILAPTADAQEAAVKEEMKKLQGTWIRIYVEVDGKKSEDGKKEPGKAIILTIKGNKYGDETFTVDPAKKPKHINVSTVDDKGKAITLRGIYELNGDVLKLCFPFPFEGKFDKIGMRPTEFGSKAGGNEVLEVYEREKK